MFVCKEMYVITGTFVLTVELQIIYIYIYTGWVKVRIGPITFQRLKVCNDVLMLGDGTWGAV